MENNKTVKVVVFTLLILGLTTLINFQKTYASFKSKEDTALVYKAQLYNLYSEKTMKLERATIDEATFSFTFKANPEVFNSETDFYEITIPNNCTFKEIILDGSGMNVDQSSHTQKVTFDKDSTGSASIYITCSVEPNQKLSYIANISETNANQQSFLYLKYSYIESYNSYLNHVYEKVESSETISATATNFYDLFIAWIKKYGQSVGYESEIEKYVRNTFPNEAAIKNPNNYKALPGFSIEYSQGNYTFKILDNFVGYARTYQSSKLAGSDSMLLYFSTKAKGTLYQAFQIYLNQYLYPTQSSTANLIYNYVSNGDYLYNVIFNGGTHTGILKQAYDEASGNSTVLYVKSSVLSAALSAANNAPYIVFDQSANMLNSFAKGLTNFYSNSISKEVRTAIYKRADIQASVTKNNSSVSTKVAFKDYFIHQDGNRYLIIEVSSDGLYNTFSITPFAVSSGDVAITFTNNDKNLVINIKHSQKSTVLKTVSDLDQYFKTTTTITSGNILSDTATECIVEYTITK